MSSLKPQPGEKVRNPRSYRLPGEYARMQLEGKSHEDVPKKTSSKTELQRVLAVEAERHSYWERWQGVTPGVPTYEEPREKLDTLGPNVKYGTEGRV